MATLLHVTHNQTPARPHVRHRQPSASLAAAHPGHAKQQLLCDDLRQRHSSRAPQRAPRSPDPAREPVTLHHKLPRCRRPHGCGHVLSLALHSSLLAVGPAVATWGEEDEDRAYGGDRAYRLGLAPAAARTDTSTTRSLASPMAVCLARRQPPTRRGDRRCGRLVTNARAPAPPRPGTPALSG
jgi:hypothetical protein